MIKSNANSKVLILGASGLLGYHCTEELQCRGFNVLGTYHSRPIEINYLVYLDASNINQLRKIISEYAPDYIINTIAYVTVDGCEIHPDKADYLNNQFVANIVKALIDFDLKKCHLIQISSDSVYGARSSSEKDLPWKETDKMQPLSVYAKTKLKGEVSALKWNNTLILRTAFYGINPYSPKSLLWWIIDNAQKGHVLEGWENIYFSPISAKELSKAITTLIEKKVIGLFNIGSNDICNKYDFVSLVCQRLELPVQIDKIHKVHENTIRPNYSVLDSSKLTQWINWKSEWRNDLIEYLENMPPYPTSKN